MKVRMLRDENIFLPDLGPVRWFYKEEHTVDSSVGEYLVNIGAAVDVTETSIEDEAPKKASSARVAKVTRATAVAAVEEEPPAEQSVESESTSS